MKTLIAILFTLLSCIYAQAQTCADGQSPIWSATTGWTCGAITPGPLPSGSSLSMTIANAGVTGTTVNRLAKLTGAPSTAVITATTDTEGAIGVCTAGCGTTGSATIAIIGQVSCAFDGATTAGNYVTISATTAGMCHDAGSAFPTAQAAYGRVLSTNGGAGTYVMELMTPDIAFQNAGNGKSKPGTPSGSIQYNNNNVFAASNLTHTSASVTTVNSGTVMRFSDSAPAISFTTQTNTGIWPEGSDQLHFRTNGNDTLNLFFVSANRQDFLVEPNEGVFGFGSTTLSAGFWRPRAGQMAVVSDHDVPPTNAGTLFSKTQDATTSSTNWVINFDIGNVRRIPLNGTQTNVNAPSNPQAGTILTLILEQDPTGSRTLTWNSAWKFVGGTAPTLTTAPNSIDILTFWTNGTNMYEISRALDVK